MSEGKKGKNCRGRGDELCYGTAMYNMDGVWIVQTLYSIFKQSAPKHYNTLGDSAVESLLSTRLFLLFLWSWLEI